MPLNCTFNIGYDQFCYVYLPQFLKVKNRKETNQFECFIKFNRRFHLLDDRRTVQRVVKVTSTSSFIVYDFTEK